MKRAREADDADIENDAKALNTAQQTAADGDGHDIYNLTKLMKRVKQHERANGQLQSALCTAKQQIAHVRIGIDKLDLLLQKHCGELSPVVSDMLLLFTCAGCSHVRHVAICESCQRRMSRLKCFFSTHEANATNATLRSVLHHFPYAAVLLCADADLALLHPARPPAPVITIFAIPGADSPQRNVAINVQLTDVLSVVQGKLAVFYGCNVGALYVGSDIGHETPLCLAEEVSAHFKDEVRERRNVAPLYGMIVTAARLCRIVSDSIGPSLQLISGGRTNVMTLCLVKRR